MFIHDLLYMHMNIIYPLSKSEGKCVMSSYTDMHYTVSTMYEYVYNVIWLSFINLCKYR